MFIEISSTYLHEHLRNITSQIAAFAYLKLLPAQWSVMFDYTAQQEFKTEKILLDFS